MFSFLLMGPPNALLTFPGQEHVTMRVQATAIGHAPPPPLGPLGKDILALNLVWVKFLISQLDQLWITGKEYLSTWCSASCLVQSRALCLAAWHTHLGACAHTHTALSLYPSVISELVPFKFRILVRTIPPQAQSRYCPDVAS